MRSTEIVGVSVIEQSCRFSSLPIGVRIGCSRRERGTDPPSAQLCCELAKAVPSEAFRGGRCIAHEGTRIAVGENHIERRIIRRTTTVELAPSDEVRHEEDPVLALDDERLGCRLEPLRLDVATPRIEAERWAEHS